jgi:hypothetical protein
MIVTEEMMREQNFFLKFRVSFSDFQAKVLWTLVQKGCLNSMEVCRVLNGFGRDDFTGCYAHRRFAYVTRPERCNHIERSCCFWSLKVYNALRWLERKRVLQSVKTLHYDKRKGKGKRFDLFRFWFIHPEAYESRINKQKLTGYL